MCHDFFVIQELCIGKYLILPIDTPSIGLVGESGLDSELSASSDNADCAAVAGAGTSANSEASSDHKTPKEPHTPSSLVADQKVCRSVCAPHQNKRL